MTGMIEVTCYLPKEAALQLAATLEQEKDEGETAKHRGLVREYVQGNGVDLGSAGVPVCPWAIQLDLPPSEYTAYNPVRGDSFIHWRGSALDLPFKDGTLDFVHASHLLEDFEDWALVLAEWGRVLKPGGYLIIAVPDHERFRARVKRAMDDHGVNVENLSHKHESRVGELSDLLITQYETLLDQFVSDSPEEYSIIYCGRKR